MTPATVTPLREKQLVKVGDQLCSAIESLENGLCDMLAGKVDELDVLEIRLRCDGIRARWKLIAYGEGA